MTLLNGILALGSLAFAVPLVIHLLFKSRFRTIDWGAMHLLDGVVRINRRRIQLLHLLLLLIRCMLPVLLAFCLARPVLTGFRALPGDAPQTLILAIDDSRSMAARDATGTSRIDRIRQELTDLLESLSRRDEIMVLTSSRLTEPAATMGPQAGLRRLRELTADAGPIDLARLVRAAVDAADQASHTQRRILVVSDFASHHLDESTIQSLRRLSTNLAGKSVRPLISFLNLGVGSKDLENVSVESVTVDSPAVIAGRGARFSAILRNASDRQVTDIRVTWSVNGKAMAPQSVSIPPRSSATSRMSRRITEVGVHELAVSVERSDALIEDNIRRIAVDVIREVDVLLVDGRPSSLPLQAETDFLAIALSPFAFGGQDQPDAVRTAVVSANQLEGKLANGDFDIVVLANVERLDDSAMRVVSSFVRDGGALMIFDGDTVDPNFYNRPWGDQSDAWRLPAELNGTVGGDYEPDAESFAVGDLNGQYGPWKLLGTPEQRPFGEVEVFQYRKLRLLGDSSAAASVLLTLDGGDPLIVSSARGSGKVVQFALPCDADWTSLPLRTVYLPMMQQLVLDLAGSRKQTTHAVGTAFSVPASELTALLPEDITLHPTQGASFTVESPDGVEAAVTPTGETTPRLIVAQPTLAGTYRLRQTTPLAEETPIVTSTIRVVDVPPIESQLRDAEPSRLAAAASLVEAEVYTDVASLESDERTRRYGREVWRWLLAVLLVAMIAELLLQQWSVRSPSMGAR